jgi:hypothetical protein
LDLRGVRGDVPVDGRESLVLALMDSPAGFFDRPLYFSVLLPTEVSVPNPVATLMLLLVAGDEKKRPLRLLMTWGRVVLPPPLELWSDVVEGVVTRAGGRPGDEPGTGTRDLDDDEDRSVFENENAFDAGRCSPEDVGARGWCGAGDAHGSAGYALGGNGDVPGLLVLPTRT